MKMKKYDKPFQTRSPAPAVPALRGQFPAKLVLSRSGRLDLPNTLPAGLKGDRSPCAVLRAFCEHDARFGKGFVEFRGIRIF